jgi:organic hydroperoxide reductase OsmC/OhrA
MLQEFDAETLKVTLDKDTWITSASDQALHAAVPEEFGGVPHGATPEHLFALSILNCYLATFKVISEKSGYTFTDLSGTVTIGLEKDAEPPINKAVIHVELQGDQTHGERIARKALQHCYVHQSIKTPVHVSLNGEDI